MEMAWPYEMCSIIGYRGPGVASETIVRGLKKMEYRGYDSVGIATLSGELIQIRKGVGRVSDVNASMKLDTLPGRVGIGHTRWATHGGVTAANAHPHCSSSGRLSIVHNGIIDNYLEIKERLMEKGYYFKSQTDSEVIANLLQMNYDLTGDVKDAMLKTVSELAGTYAFIAMFHNGILAAARYNEPLIVGVGKDCHFISSDVLGFVSQVSDAVFLRDGEIAILDSDLSLYDFEGNPVQQTVIKLAKNLLAVEKGEYAHFTLKEIFEQPSTIVGTDQGGPEFDMLSLYLKHAKNLYITGSGTSYNAALVGSYLLRKYASIRAEPLVASETPFLPLHFDRQSVLLALSQSGESADVLKAVNIATKGGARIVSIVNVPTSTLVRESSVSIGLNCGPEIGVAATKSFTSQLSTLYRLAEKLSSDADFRDFDKIPQSISEILFSSFEIRKIAHELRNVSDIYVLGRGIHYPIAIEGALKIKEITYIHAEGISGGELKHGPLAMMHDGVYAILINPGDSTFVDTLAGANEIKARGAKIIGISDKPNLIYDRWIKIPSVPEVFYPLVEVVPFQLLAYYAAVERNADPDYPRNLAKCVTVK